MTIDTAKLKAAAEKATPGPWRRTATIFNGITYGPFSLTNEKVLANVAEKANAEFIAAANPASVLELIAALEAARADCRENAARIAELEEAKSLHDEGVSMLCGQFDELAAATGWTTEIAMSQGVGQLEYARNLKARIAELEARKITVRFDAIPMSELGNGSDGKAHPYLFGAGYNSATVRCKSELQLACAAAGINLETGGEA
ncbi:ead/Ea22-like family protein [Cronobacter malonaticus]|nr:ead/Ea22-like family protein [Cronobacter malonaticus]